MSRPKNTAPVYKLHSSTGLARCWLNRKRVTLGKYGTPESRAHDRELRRRDPARGRAGERAVR